MNTSHSSDVVGLPSTPAFTIFRRTRVQTETGYSRSTIYLRISQGLFPTPVRLAGC
jgi:predicted DNA-binding transcriptional regulator AlpA